MCAARKKRTGQRVALFLNFFPGLSERFIINEVIGLRARGLTLDTYALNRPPQGLENKEVPELIEGTHYILPSVRAHDLVKKHFYFLFRHPRTWWRTFWFAWRNRTRGAALIGSLWQVAVHKRELDKEQRQNVLLHFVLIVPTAFRLLGKGYRIIHAQFADSAASLAMLAAMLIDVPFSFTAHAYDIFTPQVIFDKKLARAQFIVTCTRYNKRYLLEHFPELDAEKIFVNYHGADWRAMTPGRRQGTSVPAILSVGRLVPKKGMAVLLHACKILRDQQFDFKCLIIGDGPERPRLELFIRLNHLMDVVEISGYMPPSEVIERYREAALFVLPCIIDETGNRDGIPNVIAEAMAMEVPVISTPVSGIPELIEDGKSGILLEETSPEALARVIRELAETPHKAARIGKAARKRVAAVFDAAKCLDDLHDFFTAQMGAKKTPREKDI